MPLRKPEPVLHDDDDHSDLLVHPSSASESTHTTKEQRDQSLAIDERQPPSSHASSVPVSNRDADNVTVINLHMLTITRERDHNRDRDLGQGPGPTQDAASPEGHGSRRIGTQWAQWNSRRGSLPATGMMSFPSTPRPSFFASAIEEDDDANCDPDLDLATDADIDDGLVLKTRRAPDMVSLASSSSTASGTHARLEDKDHQHHARTRTRSLSESDSLETLSPFCYELAKQELAETAIVRHAALRQLRCRLNESHPALSKANNDASLLRFLRARHFDVGRSYRLLLNHDEFKKQQTLLFSGTDEERAAEMRTFIDLSFQLILRERSRRDAKVMVITPRYLNLNEFPFVAVMRCGITLCDALSYDLQTQIRGLDVIVDMTGFSITRLIRTNLDLSSADKETASSWLHNCCPFRINSVHVVHQPWSMSLVWAIVKPFFSSKVLDKVQLHGGSVNDLFRDDSDDAVFERSSLPVSCGGPLSLLSACFNADELLQWIEDSH